ncbi:MAG: hypothetical protein JSV19_08670 [Phycisphaerales bacterium]|nr:MAG: hypothetical protein JSV19_08670 [Phycisphaerales bacterium]
MQRLSLGLLLLVLGCHAPPAPSSSSGEPEATLPDGGLEATYPFFGRMKTADPADQEFRESGDFMLARCGCNCWRVLVSQDDGSVRAQFLVHFSWQEHEASAAKVHVLGEDNGTTLSGIVDQNTGLTEGRMLIGPYAMVFAAGRSEEPADKVKTCVMCHVGEAPPWPLPSHHPQYEADPPTCLRCHPVD